MNFFRYLRLANTSAIAIDADSLKGKTLEQHDAVHHPDGYEDGDVCKFRDRINEEARPDDLNPGGLISGVKNSESALQTPSDGTTDKIFELMTPERCQQMIRRAFIIGEIGNYYGIRTPEEWLKKEGPDDVAMIVENYSELYHEYIQPIEDDLHGDGIVEVIKAYQRGKLTGKRRNKVEGKEESRIDIAESPRVSDARFYSPRTIDATKDDLNMAMRKAVGKDKDLIYEARGKVLMFSHNRGAAEKLGLTQTSLNKLLKVWSSYPASARELSLRVNSDVGESAQWHGLENMANLSRYNVKNEDVAKLVESIEGDSNQFQRNYIARTMLALDTHIDYTDLSFEFKYGQIRTIVGHENCNGYYSNNERKIVCKMNAPNTVAHEMGHYIDHKWAEDLGEAKTFSLGMTSRLSDRIRRISPEIGKFCDNFDSFMEDINNSADEHNAYTLDRAEIFARFVDRFVEWTEKKATGRNNMFRDYSYNDKFTESQFLKFVRILQEKAYLDAKQMVK